MSKTAQNTVAYIAYGKSVFRNGAVFSYLTAKHFDKDEDLRYLIYTDQPQDFLGLDVLIETIDQQRLEGWSGGSDYIHRRTIAILKDALEKYGGSIALIDTDTYFQKSPRRLFDKIGPGRVCLHVFEASLKDCGSYTDDRLLDVVKRNHFLDVHSNPVALHHDSPMWNAGVIGMNIADVFLLDEILFVIDRMWIKARVSNLQQFVTGSLLSSKRQVSPAFGVVFHYWEYSARQSFEARLPVIINALEHLPLSEKASRAYAARPRAGLPRKFKNTFRMLGRKVGVRFPGIVKNI